MRIEASRVLRVARVLLFLEAGIFAGSALVDLALYGGSQAPSALLHAAVGVANLLAAVSVSRELATPSGSPPGEMRQPWELVGVTVAQAAAIPLLLVPLWTEWNSGAHGLGDVALSVIVLLMLAVALFLTGAALVSRPETALTRTWVVLLALLPLASSVQFWYTTFYKPAHQRPNVNIVANLDAVGSDEDVTRVKATVTLENSGSTDVAFFDAIYSVSGLGLSPADDRLTKGEFLEAVEPTQVAANDRDASYEGALDVGRLIRPGGHLAPAQSLTTSFVFDVDEARQDKLRLTVQLSALVGEGENLGTFTDCRAGLRFPNACREASIPTEGWLRTLLADRPRARTIIGMPPGSPPYLRVEFGYADSDSEAFSESQQVRDLYPYVNSRGFTTSAEFGLTP